MSQFSPHCLRGSSRLPISVHQLFHTTTAPSQFQVPPCGGPASLRRPSIPHTASCCMSCFWAAIVCSVSVSLHAAAASGPHHGTGRCSAALPPHTVRCFLGRPRVPHTAFCCTSSCWAASVCHSPPVVSASAAFCQHHGTGCCSPALPPDHLRSLSRSGLPARSCGSTPVTSQLMRVGGGHVAVDYPQLLRVGGGHVAAHAGRRW